MNEQLIEIASEWATKYPDFLEDFMGMILEYKGVADAAGFNIEELTFTKACLTAVSDLFETLEGK